MLRRVEGLFDELVDFSTDGAPAAVAEEALTLADVAGLDEMLVGMVCSEFTEAAGTCTVDATPIGGASDPMGFARSSSSPAEVR